MPEEVQRLVDKLTDDNPDHNVLSINCSMRFVEGGVEFRLGADHYKAYAFIDQDSLLGEGIGGLLDFFQFLEHIPGCIQTVMEQNMNGEPSGSIHVMKDGKPL